MATSFAAIPFTIRANGRASAMAGISVIGTRPEYRRQGLVRAIMTRAFAEQRREREGRALLDWGIVSRYLPALRFCSCGFKPALCD